jgi:glycosyltransferase involved in cell wall biosynthesis
MGGGVGKVISGGSRFSAAHGESFSHRVVLLEEPEKRQFVDLAQAGGVDVRVCADYEEIGGAMGEADIVQIEWWHHPAMARFLRYLPQVAIRLVVWSHISGSYYPWLPFAFVRKPHRFIFTSHFSKENHLWSTEERAHAEARCPVVNSSGGFDGIAPARGGGPAFTVGYVGTLSYAKLHPRFPDVCRKIAGPGVKIVLVGDDANREGLRDELSARSLDGAVEFRGYAEDVSAELAGFDVFAYPLSPRHYGTTENALLEAMAAGLPAVVFNQCAEKYLVRHMETGLLAESVEDFAACVRYLRDRPEERARIGRNALEWVRRELSVEKTVRKLHACYEEVMAAGKRTFRFVDVFGEHPHDWVAACAALTPILREYAGTRGGPDGPAHRDIAARGIEKLARPLRAVLSRGRGAAGMEGEGRGVIPERSGRTRRGPCRLKHGKGEMYCR